MLSSLPLPDLLNLIENKGHTGKLKLSRDTHQVTLFVSDGRIVFCSSLMDPDLIAGQLALMGHISYRELLEWKREVRAGRRETVLDFLPGSPIPNEAWNEAFHQVFENETTHLFSWNDGSFEFESCEIDIPQEVRLNLTIADYSAEATVAARQWQEVLSALPDEDKVPMVVDFTDPEFEADIELGPRDWQLLAHVDGRKNLFAIASSASISRVEACRSFLRMLEGGYLRWGDPCDAVQGQATSENGGSEVRPRGRLGRLLSREKAAEANSGQKACLPVEVAEFENRLLEQLASEQGMSEDERMELLRKAWRDLLIRHPLLDYLPRPNGRVDASRFEREFLLWDDEEATENLLYDCLDALRVLIESTYLRMVEVMGDKKALQVYLKMYEPLAIADLSVEAIGQLDLLGLKK